jgi:hypothetical protein
MTWRTSVIDSSLSVAAHESRLNGNASYINTTAKVDHYFNESNSNLDGHHQIVQMTAETADPSLATDMKGALYVKETDKALASDGTTDELWFLNGVGAFQVSGIRIAKNKVDVLAQNASATAFTTSAKQAGIIISWSGDTAAGSQTHSFATNDSGTPLLQRLSGTLNPNINHTVSGSDILVKNTSAGNIKMYSMIIYTEITE